jgi:hypothetical protein
MQPFEWAEHTLSERATDDLPTLHLADVASSVLGMVLQRVELPARGDADPGDPWYQIKALLYLGVLAGRSLRATMALLCVGYDAEALAFKRRLVEIHARAQRVTDERNGGRHARDWLRGKDQRPSSVVALPDGAWHSYSHLVHADYRAVEHHLVKRHNDGRTTFSLLPMRNVEIANATLVMSASETRDVAAVTAAHMRLAIKGLEALDAELRAAMDRYVTGAAAAGSGR